MEEVGVERLESHGVNVTVDPAFLPDNLIAEDVSLDANIGGLGEQVEVDHVEVSNVVEDHIGDLIMDNLGRFKAFLIHPQVDLVDLVEFSIGF